jgi:hypothetical protein
MIHTLTGPVLTPAFIITNGSLRCGWATARGGFDDIVSAKVLSSTTWDLLGNTPILKDNRELTKSIFTTADVQGTFFGIWPLHSPSEIKSVFDLWDHFENNSTRDRNHP